MINYLHIALWLVCFFDAIILLCLPTAEKIMFSSDGSAARYIVDLMALGIGLTVLFTNGWKKLPSKALGLLLGLMLVSHFHAPNIQFQSTFLPPDHAIFDYKPMFEVLLFFVMFMGIYSMEIGDKLKNLIRQTLVWIPTIYAGFAILQRLGLDQFYKLISEPISQMSRNPEVGGFIGQPVFCAALIAICMSFVFRHGKIWHMAVCIIGVLVTGNRSAMIAIVICALFTSQYKNIGKILLGAYISYLALGVIIQFFPSIHLPHMGEERFTIWREVIQDFTNSHFPGINNSQILTGTGLGSFSVIFPFYHGNGYYQAHNEFLESLRCLGIIGFGLLFYFIRKIPCIDKSISGALFASCILALTNAIWHIPQLAFVTVFLIAMAYNKTVGENYVES